MCQLTAPPAETVGVLSGASTLLPCHSRRGTAALVSLRSDFWADALRLWSNQSFGARPAPHSRVVVLARVLPSGAPPHLPGERHTGHTRGWGLLDQEKRRETQNTGHAAPARHRRGSGASAGRAAWGHTPRSRGKTAIVWWSVWGPRAGCRQSLQRCVSHGQSTSLGLNAPRCSHSIVMQTLDTL